MPPSQPTSHFQRMYTTRRPVAAAPHVPRGGADLRHTFNPTVAPSGFARHQPHGYEARFEAITRQRFRSVRADRLLTPCLPERDGRRVSRLEMGLVANQACSPEDGGEHKNPANLLETPWFQVSPPVNPMPACRPCRIPDSSPTPRASLPGCSLILKRIERFWRFSDHPF